MSHPTIYTRIHPPDNPQLAVDGVFCISLAERDDRRTLITEEFRKSGLPIEFILVTKDQANPQRGCYTSHQHCARLALERSYRSTLILEDDATLPAWPPQAIHRINRFITHRQPDILHIGAILGSLWLTWHPGIARCKAAGTHAYILSAKACTTLLENPYSTQGIDTFYRKTFRQYCTFPLLSEQQPEDVAPSDINRVRKHYDKRHTWDYLNRKQYREALKNLWKTLLHIDL